MTSTDQTETLDLTREQVVKRFDADARRYLGMSGDEFRRLVETGAKLPEHPVTAHLLVFLGAPSARH